jgi:hypothetical protein
VLQIVWREQKMHIQRTSAVRLTSTRGIIFIENAIASRTPGIALLLGLPKLALITILIGVARAEERVEKLLTHP